MEIVRKFKLVLVEGAEVKAFWDLVIVDKADDNDDPMWEQFEFIIAKDELDSRAEIDFETHLYDVLQEIYYQ